MGGNVVENGVFPHIGIGISLSAGETYNIFPISLSGGLVGGKFEKNFDYSGNIDGIGLAFCYYPGGSRALSATIDINSLANAMIENHSATASIRLDWYFMMPDENTLEETSWEKQFSNLEEY